MKITQLKPNYNLQQSKPETSKQAHSTNPMVDEKEVFSHLKGQNLTFAGVFDFLKKDTSEGINKKEACEKAANTVFAYNDFEKGIYCDSSLDSFINVITCSEFDYSYKTHLRTLNEHINNTIDKLKGKNNNIDRINARIDALRTMRAALYASELSKDKELPKDIKEFFKSEVNTKDFLLHQPQCWRWDFDKTEKAINRLEKEFNIDVKDYPQTLITSILNGYGEYAKLLVDKGIRSDVKGQDGRTALEMALTRYHKMDNLFPKDELFSFYLNKGDENENVVKMLNKPDFDLDNIGGKNIEAVINEQVKDETTKEQFLSLISEIRKSRETKELQGNDKKFLEFVDAKTASSVEILLNSDKSINVNAQDENGNTALMKAINNNDIYLFNLLLSHPDIDINIKNKNMDSALFMALSHIVGRNYDLTMFNALIKHPNININEIDKDGDTVGIEASKSGRTDVLDNLKEIKEFNPNYINMLTNKPSSMIYSAYIDDKTIDKVLEFDGIDINANIPGKEPPIIYFIRNGSYSNFSAIAHHPDANLEITDKDGKNLVEIIDGYNGSRTGCIKELQSARNKQFIRQINAITKQYGTLSQDSIKKFLEYPDIQSIINDSLSDAGETIAHYLPEYKVNIDNLDEINELYKIFKSAKPDINKQNAFGLTPLMNAVNSQNLFAIEFFLKNGAKKDIKNKGGETAVDMANDSNNEKLKQIFNSN